MRIRSLIPLVLSSYAAAKILYAGVNESGGEFGSSILPGEFGVNYAFINKSTIDIFVDKDKINVFRVAFLLERMCPLATGLGPTFNETYWAEFKDAIDYITVTKGAYALTDAHNYMRYNDPSAQPVSGSVIGNSSDPKAATTAQFAAFYREFARRFAANEKVIFGIMNEPHDMPTPLIVANNQAAINAIRAAGAEQLILAPGNGYTGGHSWNQSTCATCQPSADYLYELTDPLANTAIDVHEYLDVDFSGGHQACVSPGPANLAGLTAWLQTHKLKAFISEFGAANNTGCAQAVTDLLTYLGANDVYIGWTAWAAGPLWGSYPPCCGDGALLGSLEPNVAAGGGGLPLYNTVWLKTIEPLLPSGLQRSGISSLS